MHAAALILLTVLACACGVYWTIVLWHIWRTARRLPTARSALRLSLAEALRNPAAAPTVCVIVPAHNEAGVIAPLARSLAAQDYPAMRVVFSLDRCTDDTAARIADAVGADPRFAVHQVPHCPPDWAGKVHAIHSAVTASPTPAGADLLLFADADTTFDPGCIRACVTLLRTRELDLLSLLSTLSRRTWFERIVQPAAAMELIRQYPPLKVGRGAASRPFANGQFMLARREAYEAIGGHAAVKDDLLEDIELARRFAWSDRTVGVFLADGMLRCRMYDSWPEFRRGWKRIYTEAANCRPDRLIRSALRLGATGVALPVGAAVALVAGTIVGSLAPGPLPSLCSAAGGAGLAVYLLAATAAMRMGSAAWYAALVYPLGAIRTMGIICEAAADLRAGRPTRWGGRDYPRAARPPV